MSEKYFLHTKRFPWIDEPTEEEFAKIITETDFSEEQIRQGKDFCYHLNKITHTTNTQNSYYCSMVYSLTQPDTLNGAGVIEHILHEEETYHLYRLWVYRNGEWIDKIPDTSFKVIEHEDESRNGIISNQKKLNISVKGLQLYDIFVIEDCFVRSFGENTFMLPNFFRAIEVLGNVYWAYAHYHFRLINERKEDIIYQKKFFRDDLWNLTHDEVWTVKPGKTFELSLPEYVNLTDVQREEYPYIDFVTKTDWKAITNFVVPRMEKVLQNVKLTDFAPEFAQELDRLTDIEEKIFHGIQYIQNQIRYIYDAGEMDDFIPQHPKHTRKNKQWDCKAKSALLKIVLEYIGVQADLTLVNYRTDSYIWWYLPSPLLFNHMIVRVTFQEKEYFIDVTSTEEYGYLEEREVYGFLYYLPLVKEGTLQCRTSYTQEKYAYETVTRIEVQKGVGHITITDTHRYGRANGMRKTFKNSNKRKMIDDWNESIFYCLNFHNSPEKKDPRNVFSDVTLEVVSDDHKKNEITLQYTARVDDIYFVDKQGKKFLMFFDGYLFPNIGEYRLKDIPFFHNFDRIKSEIHLSTDTTIDTREKYTRQECDIKNPYFTYTSKKDIKKNGGSVTIEYVPVRQKEIPFEDLKSLQTDYEKIWDSNYGLGLDILVRDWGYRAGIIFAVCIVVWVVLLQFWVFPEIYQGGW